MTLDHDLAPELERALGQLPSVPATSYLDTARKVRRGRRAVTGAIALAVLTGGLALTPSLDFSADRKPVVSVGPSSGRVGAESPVTGPALKGIEAFTTEEIPSWAEEYGNHGPVALAPDGRLWVAPGAVVLRAVLNPLGPVDPGDAPTSYAVSARYDGKTKWVLLPETMDDSGRWTNDFDLWVDDATAKVKGQPSVAERLVHFVGPDSERLAAGDGVELVRQQQRVELPNYEHSNRYSVAEVHWRDKTWFVLAGKPADGAPFFDAYERAVSAPDLDRFVTWLRGNA